MRCARGDHEMTGKEPGRLHIVISEEDNPYSKTEVYVCGDCAHKIVVEWYRNNKLPIDALKSS